MKRDNQGIMFVVFGIGRSGTSAVAGCLHQMGILMGFEFIPSNNTNPKGFYEDKEILNLNKQILKKAGGTVDAAPVKNIITLSDEFKYNVKTIAKKRQGLTWGFKDPRTLFTYHVLRKELELLNEPVYVFVFRSRNAIINSLKKVGMSTKKAEEFHDIKNRHLQYWKNILPIEKQIKVNFTELLINPEKFVNQIANKLYFTNEEENKALKIVENYLDPDLKHF